MIQRQDILSMEYLKKTEFTGCHQGMRYRLEKVQKATDEEDEDGKQIVKTFLHCTVWPEPFNFITTPDSEKTGADFSFDEDGVSDAIAWMNDRLFAEKDRFDQAAGRWDSYR